MRATHPLTRPSSTLRRLSALSAAVMLALTTGSCAIGEGTQSLAITSLTAQEADAAAPQNSRSIMDNDPLSSAEGTVSMVTSHENGEKDAAGGDLTTTVVSRERSTDTLQWAVSIKPAVASQKKDRVHQQRSKCNEREHGPFVDGKRRRQS